MNRSEQHRTSVSALMGAPIADSHGRTFGRVREFAVTPLVDSSRVQALVVRRSDAKSGDTPSLVPVSTMVRGDDGKLRLLGEMLPDLLPKTDEYLLLERDLLDQQIIDVHGHKVVRVNDVDLVWEMLMPADAAVSHLTLRIAEVEVGLRGALRRLLKGLPDSLVDQLACRIRPSVIPWDFVDLIDRDPARRVRLKIEQERLSSMHPSDLADILEELAPAERQALFSSLDEEVAAEALEEVEPRTQKKLVESLDSEQVAGIIEEMDPGAAADLLSSLSEERSDAILEEMSEKERHDVEELLDYAQDSAAGLMTTEYVMVGENASVAEVMESLQGFEGDLETVTDVFVVDASEHLHAVIPITRLMMSPSDAPVSSMHTGHMVTCTVGASGRKVAELFDKYNLRCLPVLDEQRRLAGVIHAEHVIAWLRTSH